MAKTRNRARSTNELRIIGGQWRSRKLTFIPGEGLRPTSDRIRETLFNWLTPVIEGAHCADLFAGSGALGLEALSRGAATCDFVDTSKMALNQIGQHLDTLEAGTHASCHLKSAENFLKTNKEPLDIVFIDPPFHKGLVEPACQLLSQLSILAAEAWVYIEVPRNQSLPTLPVNWQLHRDKTAGDVDYCLFFVAHL